jgi:hypothetical protein
MDKQATLSNKTFHRQVFITRDDLFAARWWHQEMQASATDQPSRRRALKVLLGLGGIVGMGVVFHRACADDDPAVSFDSLELQRKEGWAVGAPGKALDIPSPSKTDSAGSTAWAQSLSSLSDDLAPKQASFNPFYVPTLFEVLGNARGEGLVPLLRPMHSESMGVAEKAARALAALFATEEDRKGTALILDMPGPESVAAAVGVGKLFTPVFLYDNWPHPLGVVPSATTLAAAIYHRPDFLSLRAERVDNPAPAFVLDNRRLLPYQDESDRFDNRYLARVPSAEAMSIRRLLYVTEVAQPHEMDDLNDDFVALREKNIDVKMIALADFSPAPPNLLATEHVPATHTHDYYYGGHPYGYVFFLSSYNWSSPSVPSRRLASPLPRPVSSGNAFSPAARPTLFSSRSVGGLAGVGKQKPSGFGRVSYRSNSRSVGSATSSRSGSFGRSRSGFSG